MKNTLLSDFYTEVSSTYSDESFADFKCAIRLNHNHPVYKGHFEGFPVAPGVCLVQMIKEILMGKFQKDLLMSGGENIKFLVMINPVEMPELEIAFLVKSTGGSVDVSATLNNKGTACMKFKGSFVTVE